MRLRYGFLGALLSVMVLLLAACGGAEPTATTAPTSTPEPTATTAPADGGDEDGSGGGAADFEVMLEGEAGSDYAFAPATMELQAGKAYTIKLVSTAEFHTWTVVGSDGSYIENISVNGGETKTIEFTAPDAGTYELTCLPHQALGMTGEIIVE